jgi:hypothetical protein
MRRSPAPPNSPGTFLAAQFSADYTTNMSGFDLRQAQGWVDLERSSHLLTVELSNGRPVDLVDLTTSLSALAQDFEEFSDKNSQDPIPGNVKLYVREMRSGSIIADLMPLQRSFWLMLRFTRQTAGQRSIASSM